MADQDIVGDAVRDTFNAATAKPRAAMKAVSDAANSAVDKVKSFLPKSNAPIATWQTQPSTPAPAPKTPKAAPKGPMPKYHEGTDFVPKTGPAVLKKGEAVLNNKDAAKHRAEKKMTKISPMDGASAALAGKAETPKKEIKHILTKKAANGKGHIHVHVHTHPEHHPDEEHISQGNDGLVEHMMDHMGEANPGEAEADAGQSGIPAAGAGPTAPPAGAPGL